MQQPHVQDEIQTAACLPSRCHLASVLVRNNAAAKFKKMIAACSLPYCCHLAPFHSKLLAKNKRGGPRFGTAYKFDGGDGRSQIPLQKLTCIGMVSDMLVFSSYFLHVSGTKFVHHLDSQAFELAVLRCRIERVLALLSRRNQGFCDLDNKSFAIRVGPGEPFVNIGVDFALRFEQLYVLVIPVRSCLNRHRERVRLAAGSSFLTLYTIQ